jgi:hypothetical protein
MLDGPTTTALVAHPAHPDQGRDSILYLCLPTGRFTYWRGLDIDKQGFFSHNRELFAGIRDLTP